MGVLCELWPGYDRYDVRITFPDDTIWAVDVKDWAHAHLLAPTLTDLPTGQGYEWDRALYAVPGERVASASDYLTMLRLRSNLRRTEIVTVEAIVDEAKDKLASLGVKVAGKRRTGNGKVVANG
jgi:hypothetical protein